MNNISIKISFNKSGSQYFKNAIKLAQKIEGYREVIEGNLNKYFIQTQLDLNKIKQFNNIIDLIDLISNWKSLRILLNGKDIKPWNLKYNAIEIKNCFLKREKVGDYYCYGINAPDGEHINFGCRHIKGVNRVIGSYRFYENENIPYWFQFGKLNIAKQTYVINKKDILKIIKVANITALCKCCPFFSMKLVEEEVRILPSVIKLKDSDDFEVKYSINEKEKPIGIKPKEKKYPRGLTYSISLGNQETDQGKEERNVPTVKFSDIGGQDFAIEQIKNSVQMPLLHQEYFKNLGIKPQSGVLLYGPPGNGKTLLAKAVASESNAHLEIINGPEILSKWVGQSEENLRKIFTRARKYSPSVILIDEIDCIAPKRDLMEHQHDIQLISQLLVLLDGLEDRGAMALIATTNRIDAIDPAILRPGRIDYHIEVPLPNKEGRRAIFLTILKDIKIEAKFDREKIIELSEGYSGADISSLCREAGLHAISRAIEKKISASKLLVNFQDFNHALNSIEKKRKNFKESDDIQIL